MARFFKLTPELGKFLRENLTLSEWKLWSLFVDYDSFGDKYVEIPPLIEILMECDISQATFYRAIAKFKKLELFDFQYDKAYIRNLSASIDLSLTHENHTVTHENHTVTDENHTVTDENTSIYTELQKKKILSEAEEKNETFEISNTTNPTLSVIPETKIQPSVNAIAVLEEKFSAPPKNLQQRNFNWLPDGPWNLEGKLDPNFRDFVANDWLKRFGGDIHCKRADVLSHFKKDPANLPIRWEQYQSEYLNRYESTQILLSNGIEIKPEYQDRLIANQRAITAQLPQELNPVLQPQQAIAALPSSIPDLSLSKIPALPQVVTNEEGQTFKLFRASDSEITPEQVKANREFLADAITKLTNKKSMTQAPKEMSELGKLNLWINDPVLREMAISHVNKNSDRFEYLSSDGIPYEVIEIQPTEETEEYDF